MTLDGGTLDALITIYDGFLFFTSTMEIAFHDRLTPLFPVLFFRGIEIKLSAIFHPF